LTKLDNPYLIRFEEWFIEGSITCIITEYCKGGDLANRIREKQVLNDKFTEDIISNWTNELINAVHYLHNNDILKCIHRDIKPGNILIRTEGDITMPIIIDFGMVCKYPCNEENRCQNEEYSPNGTAYFLPQNMLNKNARFEGFKKAFPVKPKGRSWLNTVKNTVFCRRRQTRKGPNSVKVATKNIKIKGFYNIASDNYALGLTLEDLFDVIYWDKNPAEKKMAKETIARLKSQILPYLTAATASKFKQSS